MPNEFDWLAYKAKVAAIMLPYIYQQVLKGGFNKNASMMRDPVDVAIDETIDITIDMTERLEKRLKNK
jgi:hypothetical protein